MLYQSQVFLVTFEQQQSEIIELICSQQTNERLIFVTFVHYQFMNPVFEVTQKLMQIELLLLRKFQLIEHILSFANYACGGLLCFWFSSSIDF